MGAVQGYVGIALALALGLLVGVQRGWVQRMAQTGSRFAGVRTFGLFGLAGGIAGHLAASVQTVSTLILAAVAVLILMSYHRKVAGGGTISGTASLAGLITLASGFLAGSGEHLVASAIAICMVLLLTMRDRLHALVRRMSEIEVAALARFALIAGVILPLLPDRAFGPYEAWNPRQLWFVVVLVCGFSLLGYVAARLIGSSKGSIVTAAAGAVVSSTAVTVSLATRLRDHSGNPDVLHGGMAVASAVMFLRVMALTAMLAPFALWPFVRLAMPGLMVSLAASGWFWWRARKGSGEPGDGLALQNPFAIGPALLLMGLVMVASVAARWIEALYGDAGLATALALAGMVDVDSAIITMGTLPAGSLDPAIAGLVLLPPVVLNSLLKAVSALSIAGKRAWPGAAVLILSAAASLVPVPFGLQWPA